MPTDAIVVVLIILAVIFLLIFSVFALWKKVPQDKALEKNKN